MDVKHPHLPLPGGLFRVFAQLSGRSYCKTRARQRDRRHRRLTRSRASAIVACGYLTVLAIYNPRDRTMTTPRPQAPDIRRPVARANPQSRTLSSGPISSHGIVRGHVVTAVGVLRNRLAEPWTLGNKPAGVFATDAGRADGTPTGLDRSFDRRGGTLSRLAKPVSCEPMLPRRLWHLPYRVSSSAHHAATHRLTPGATRVPGGKPGADHPARDLGTFADRLGLGDALSSAIPWDGNGIPVHDRGKVLLRQS